MTALLNLSRTIQALDRESAALAAYTDSELQELADAIEAIQAFLKPIQIEAGRRELAHHQSISHHA